MEVSLISYTEKPGELCNKAALVTVSKETEHKDLLRRVISYGHTSVLEHASFTFLVEGISRACSHQLVRHRIASYSQQSQRYIKGISGVVIPDSIKNNEEAMRLYEEAIMAIEKAYEGITKEGIKSEDARYILPNAAKTNIMITMNARELLHFFNVRCCNKAQWEIREMAWRMMDLVEEKAPDIFEKSGPSCMIGVCKEGKSCGVIINFKQKDLSNYKETKERIREWGIRKITSK